MWGRRSVVIDSNGPYDGLMPSAVAVYWHESYTLSFIIIAASRCVMAKEYCLDCGVALESNANFCSECGATVTNTGGARDGVPATGTGTTDDTGFAVITHLIALFTGILGALLVVVVIDDEFVDENARNALNWQIALLIYILGTITLFAALFFFSAILELEVLGMLAIIVGFLVVFILSMLDLVFCIIAAIKANEGKAWKYPITPDIV